MFRRVTRTVAGLFLIFAAFALYAAAPSQNEPVLQEELPVFPTPGKVGFGKGVFMCTSAVRIDHSAGRKNSRSQLFDRANIFCKSFVIGISRMEFSEC